MFKVGNNNHNADIRKHPALKDVDPRFQKEIIELNSIAQAAMARIEPQIDWDDSAVPLAVVTLIIQRSIYEGSQMAEKHDGPEKEKEHIFYRRAAETISGVASLLTALDHEFADSIDKFIKS